MQTNDFVTNNLGNLSESTTSKNRKSSSFMNVRLKDSVMTNSVKRKENDDSLQNVNKKQKISNSSAVQNGRSLTAEESDEDTNLTIDEGVVKREVVHDTNGHLTNKPSPLLDMQCLSEKLSKAQTQQFSDRVNTISILENLLSNLLSEEKSTVNGEAVDAGEESKANSSKRKTRIVKRSDLDDPKRSLKPNHSSGDREGSSSPSEAMLNQLPTSARKKTKLILNRPISTKRTNAQVNNSLQTNSLNQVPKSTFPDSQKSKLSANFRLHPPASSPISSISNKLPLTPQIAKPGVNCSVKPVYSSVNRTTTPTQTAKSSFSERSTPTRKEPSPDIEVVSEKKTGNVVKQNNEITVKSPYLSVICYTALLNILARPFNMYPVSIAVRDRKDLDALVKTTLMMNQKDFVEWLFKMRLLKDRMTCYKHRNGTDIKLVLSHSSSPLPPSGGYAWMMECCQGGRKYISVFSGSIFAIGLKEKMSSTSVLKLIYHWSCQTTINNVENWVKVSRDIIGRAFNYFRCICTVILNDKLYDLGVGGNSVELGIVSLGTTSCTGNKKAVKVEIMGLYDRKTKSYRLFASSPQNTSHSTQRFMKILKPILSVVHHSAEIVCDFSVDRTCLPMMNYRNVVYCNQNSENSTQNSNSIIMTYLRKHIPKMFQNTLSTLNLEQVQLILDELCWRETYGRSPSHSYINMINHIAYLTVRETNYYGLLSFLDYVSVNPHRLWRYVSEPNVPKIVFPADEVPKYPSNLHPIPQTTTIVFNGNPIIHPAVDVDAAVRARQSSIHMPIDVDLSNLVVPYLHANKMARGPVIAEQQQPNTIPEASVVKSKAPIIYSKPIKKVDNLLTPQKPAIIKFTSFADSVGRDSPDENPSVVQNTITSPVVLPVNKEDKSDKELPALNSDSPKPQKSDLSSSKALTTSPIQPTKLNSNDRMVELNNHFYGEVPGDNKLGKEINFCELKCHKCSFKTNDNIDFYQHMKSHLLEHKIPDMVNCNYCILQFPDEETCALHTKHVHDPENDESLICRICMMTFNGEEFLITHMVKNHMEADLPYKCEVCQYSTSYYKKLVDHFVEKHRGTPYLLCHFCLSVKIISPGHHWNIGQWLLSHLTDHTKGVRCNHCLITLKKKSKASNLTHMVQHNSQRNNSALVRYSSEKPIFIPKKTLASSKANYDIKYNVKPYVAMSSEVEVSDTLSVKSEDLCKECEEPMNKKGHYRSYQKCVSCPYATSCAVMMPHHNYVFHNHNKTKKVYEIGPPILLKEPLVCNCGFSSKSGNHMARHMMRCRGANRTAYAEETNSLNKEEKKSSPSKSSSNPSSKVALDSKKLFDKKGRVLLKEADSSDMESDDPDDPDVLMQEFSDED